MVADQIVSLIHCVSVSIAICSSWLRSCWSEGATPFSANRSKGLARGHVLFRRQNHYASQFATRELGSSGQPINCWSNADVRLASRRVRENRRAHDRVVEPAGSEIQFSFHQIPLQAGFDGIENANYERRPIRTHDRRQVDTSLETGGKRGVDHVEQALVGYLADLGLRTEQRPTIDSACGSNRKKYCPVVFS